jgi:hypothetical protein
MHKDLACKVAYFSLDENNPRIKKHCAAGGLAAVYENGFVTIICELDKPMNETDMNELLKENINPIIQEVSNFLEYLV